MEGSIGPGGIFIIICPLEKMTQTKDQLIPECKNNEELWKILIEHIPLQLVPNRDF